MVDPGAGWWARGTWAKMAGMRVAVVGAGLAGLAAAAALSRTGHEVTVWEQADRLRASGLALNLWSNATSLLPGLGVPAGDLPGEPFSRMLLRASGRQVAVMDLTARGLPHLTVERAELLSALAAALPDGAIHFGVRCTTTGALAAEHDLVVVADGAHSVLRPSVCGPPGRRRTWTVWQASVAADLPEVPPGAGAAVVRPGFFGGIWRLPGGRVTWFAEQPGRRLGEGKQLLHELVDDADPVLRTLARATAPQDWIEWRATDLWPGRLYRGNIVLAGDAAHAMLPTLGQGACQAVEDAAALATALAVAGPLEVALRRYQKARLWRVRRITALARTAAASRRPAPGISSAQAARVMAAVGGLTLRRLTRPVPARLG
jgi:2-polyprenyl-6-methoxyphenol hydroxylase-like FAD-dependent oxidoreductase